MKKKGFTLIELLAVIVILAIIALIAVPIMLNVIEKSKESSAVDSAYGYIHAIEEGIVATEIKDKLVATDGTYENLKDFSKIYNVEVKGDKPSRGYITLEKKKVKKAELAINGYRIICEKGKCNVYGKYEPIIVTYDLDGATLSKTKENIYKGDTIELPVPEKTHYGFDGWYTEPDGKGIKVDNESIFNENMTLYAYFIKNRYTIIFDAGEGTATESSMSVESGDTLNLPNASREGYTFNGWYREDNTEVTNETIFTSNQTVYAHYTKNVYMVTYNAGNGTVTPGSAQVEHGNTLNLPTPVAPTNYIFVGWYTSSNGGSEVTNETVFTESKEIYARYAENRIVTYNANGGTGSMSNSSGANITLKANTFTAPSNKVFAEWNTKADGSGTSYSEGQVVNTNLNLYAIWKGQLKLSNGTTINVSKSAETLKNYYGQSVSSSFFTSNEGSDWTWQLFYDDEDYIFLIASDYVPNSKLPANGNPGYGTSDLIKSTNSTNSYSTYCAGFTTSNSNYVYSKTQKVLSENRLTAKYLKFGVLNPNRTTGNMKATRFMMDTSKWSQFAGNRYLTAEAIGGPTIELFAKSWNSIPSHSDTPFGSYDTLTSNLNHNANGYKAYNYKTNSWTDYVGSFATENNMWFTKEQSRAAGLWISSPSTINEWNIRMIWAYDIGYGGGTDTTIGFRPIVSIAKSEIK